MSDVQIKARENGPYAIIGPITLVDAEGNDYEVAADGAVALCRCGASANKPFCDGSHKVVGFDAPERAVEGS